MDNNGNGQVDESWEYDHDGNGISNWGETLDSDLKIIIYDGRKEEQLNGEDNPWYYVDGQVSTDDHIRGDYMWVEDDFTIMFDVYTQDFGNDGLAGDYFIDVGGNDTYEVGEPTLSFGDTFGLRIRWSELYIR